MTDRGDYRDAARRHRPRDGLLVERPQIFDAAAAAGDDQNVGSWHWRARRQPIEAGDRRGDLFRGLRPLHEHRPEEHAPGESIGETVQNVTDHGAGRRCDDADDIRQERNRLFPRGIEQTFRRQPAAPLLEQAQQCAFSRQFEQFDNQLIPRSIGVSGQAPGGDHVEAVLGRDAEPVGCKTPAHAVEAGIGVFQREIQVTGGGALEAADFAAHPHRIEASFDVSLQRLRQLADGQDRQVVATRVDGRMATHE